MRNQRYRCGLEGTRIEGDGKVVVQPMLDQILRRGADAVAERTAVPLRRILVDHNDLKPRCACAPQLLCKLLTGGTDIRLPVQIEHEMGDTAVTWVV